VAALDGKVCVITGAAGVIGRESVDVFTREGATVVGVDVKGTVDAPLFLTADLTDPRQVEAVYSASAERFGHIDVLFNNAGIAVPEDGSVLDTDLETWRRVIEVNLTSIFLCCKYGIPHLLRAGGGSVINTSSLVATMGSAVSQIAYTASKGGVLSLSRELGVEFARRGVRVNALCPGPVDTPLLRSLFRPEETARPVRPVRAGQGDRRGRRLPGQRRVLLRERYGVPGGRRDLGRVRHGATCPLTADQPWSYGTQSRPKRL
jgi:NAD(P)-dependent dehydrogenase (short-subunit alcohol dehydrogenase family)